MSVERESCLEAQGVTSSKSGRSNSCLGERRPQFGCMGCGYSDLDPVFSGVTGASHNDWDTAPFESTNIKSCDRRNSLVDVREQRTRVRTLYGENRSFRSHITGVNREPIKLHGDLFESAGDSVGIRRVRHDIKRLTIDPPDDDVVDDRCVIDIKEMRVLSTTRRDPLQVIRECSLQYLERAWSRYAHCSEMRNVEHHSTVTTGPMLGESSVTVGKRHIPTAERNHFGSDRTVYVVKRRESIGHAPTLVSEARARDHPSVIRAQSKDVLFRLRLKVARHRLDATREYEHPFRLERHRAEEC